MEVAPAQETSLGMVRNPPTQSIGDGMETKLADMRSSLIAKGFSIQGIDDSYILRFLRARSMHVPAAAKMLAEELTWRASFMPLGYIPEIQVESELAQEKTYLQGVSKKSSFPLLLMIARRHFSNSDCLEFKRFVVYSLEKTMASAPPGIEKYVVMVDLEGVGYKNMDLKSLVSGLQLVQNYFPERLARMYLVKAPSIFLYFWKMASPFVDEVTRAKIMIADDKKITDALIEEFGVDVIPQEYGGKAEMIRIQDACVPNWPPKVSQCQAHTG